MGRFTHKISQRLIPLPKEISCNDIKKVAFGDVKIDVIYPEDALLLSAKRKLVSYFGNSIFGSFRIRIVDPMPDTVKVLNNFKNPDQAYRIWYDGSLSISALTSKGIMYGVRTLLQAVTKEDNYFMVPLLFVFDYPDIALRGQWGGNSMHDIDYTSSFKLNSLDYTGTFKTGSDNKMTGYLEDPTVADKCVNEGVTLTAYITHLEILISFYLNKPENADLIEKIRNVPTPEAKARNDYKPGLCMSSEHTKNLVHDCMKSLAQISGVSNVMVWLSENTEPCMCDECKGKQPFILETRMLVSLFDRLKAEYPGIGREILLTQGSYPVNKEILEIVPKDISVIYYHGSKTYISDKNPMIYEDLSPFIEKGGKLGVYPQITHGWRCVFPWTAPDFIKYRCTEFQRKNIHKVVGYAVPSNIYHRFNITAIAEWLWNTDGRDEQAFMEAFATINGIDQQAFVQWCNFNMQPSWTLAQNRFIVSQVFNYPVIMKTRFDNEDFRFTDYTRSVIEDIDKDIRRADKAVKAAKSFDYTLGEIESRCVHSTLRCCGAYQKFFALLNKKDRNTEEDMQMSLMYEMMYNNAKNSYNGILSWKKEIDHDNKHFHTRLMDTAVICMRIADFMKKVLEKLDIKHKVHHSIEYTALGKWEETDFSGQSCIKTFDITDIADKPGRYHVCFDYSDSSSGTDVLSVNVTQNNRIVSDIVYDYSAPLKRINMHEPWYELLMDIDSADKNEKRILNIELKGPAEPGVTCKGLIGIRKV